MLEIKNSSETFPLEIAIPLGIRRVFAMFAGNVTVPLVLARAAFVLSQSFPVAGKPTLNIRSVEQTSKNQLQVASIPFHDLAVGSSWVPLNFASNLHLCKNRAISQILINFFASLDK